MTIATTHPANVIGTQLDCILAPTSNPGIGLVKPAVDGNTFANAAFKLSEEGVFSVTSYDISGALGLLDDNFSGAGASDLFAVPLTAAGGKTTSSAKKYSMADSLAVWTRISAQPRQLATISMDVHAYGSEGIAETDSQTASSHTIGSDSGFVIHSVTVNGTAVGDIQGVEISSNIQILKTPQEGSILPGNVVCKNHMPMVTFRTLKYNAFQAETALNGTAGIVVVLAKYDVDGGGLVSGGNHIELTFASGVIRRSQVAGDPVVATYIAEITGATKAALCAVDVAHSIS